VTSHARRRGTSRGRRVALPVRHCRGRAFCFVTSLPSALMPAIDYSVEFSPSTPPPSPSVRVRPSSPRCPNLARSPPPPLFPLVRLLPQSFQTCPAAAVRATKIADPIRSTPALGATRRDATTALLRWIRRRRAIWTSHLSANPPASAPQRLSDEHRPLVLRPAAVITVNRAAYIHGTPAGTGHRHPAEKRRLAEPVVDPAMTR